jgi:hypothetical protein
MYYNGAMSTQTASSTTIKINVPAGMMQNAKQEANRIGISLQDFIRMVMATYFARGESIRAVSRDRVLFDQAQKDIREGKYTTIQSKEELDEYFDTLDA